MILKKKDKPTNNASPWTKGDRKKLKGLVKEGKSTIDIADELGRTPAAILYQKSVLGIATKKSKVKNKEGKTIDLPEMSTRDQAKEMSAVARQIARVNGKRITMAMFFVEDL